jgi:hypothetical protein
VCRYIPLLRLCINFEKNVLGYTLGDFFTSSSGRPDSQSWESEEKGYFPVLPSDKKRFFSKDFFRRQNPLPGSNQLAGYNRTIRQGANEGDQGPML